MNTRFRSMIALKVSMLFVAWQVAGMVTALPPPRVSWPVRLMEESHITATVPSPWFVADTPPPTETRPACGAVSWWPATTTQTDTRTGGTRARLPIRACRPDPTRPP